MDEKKGSNIQILEVRGLFPLSDYFIIATGQSSKQLRSTAETLMGFLKENRVTKIGIEGNNEGKWLLLDYGYLIIHLFLEEARQFYDLELLWGDAPKISWEPFSAPDEESSVASSGSAEAK